MIREIKTRLSLDGEKEFKNAMADANREMRVMNADLKAMAAEFTSTGDKQKYFTDRAETMGSKVKQQELIVEALQKAVKDSAQAYGEAARQTDDYRIQLSNATAKLFDMRRASEDANRELEELGRDSGKIGRQIERGIGDAAEGAGEKLDSMFERVQKDVNALKTSVGFQVASEVGGFVFDSIQGIMGFVDENTEFNRKMSQAKTIIEMYGYNWDEIYEIIRHATGVIGDYDTAQSAIVNLAGAGFETEEQIKATVENLLGIYTSSGGQLDFSGLAEDYLESVKEKSPTGTFAEAIIKFTDRSVQDVQKVLENAKSHADTLEIATGILTEAGLQNKSKNWVEENKTIYDAELAKIDLAGSWAALSLEITPVITGMIKGTTEVVDGLLWVINKIKELPFAQQILNAMTVEASAELAAANAARKVKELQQNEASEEEIQAAKEYAETQKKGSEALKKYNRLNIVRDNTDWFVSPDSFVDWFKNLFPSAGAETLTAENADPYEAGFQAMQQYNMGLQEAANEEVTAAQAAVATTIAQMQTEEQMEAAFEAGKNAMISFGNGIAEGAAIPINNVRDMVNAINNMMAKIATQAYGLGWSGVTGRNIYLYNAQRNNARNVSKMIGSGVQVQMLKG